MSIGENIKRFREAQGLTQEELGKIAGVSFQAVSMWERDEREPRMGVIQKIADYFGIKKSHILEFDARGEKPPSDSPQLAVLFSRSRKLSNSQLEAVNRIVAEMVKEEEPYDD